EDCLGGKVERVGDLLDNDFDIGEETRPEKDLDLGILVGGKRQPGVFAILIGVGGIGTAHEALDGIHAATAAAIALPAAHLGHQLLTFFGAGVLHSFAHFLAIGIGHGAAPALAAAIAATSAAGVASGHTTAPAASGITGAALSTTSGTGAALAAATTTTPAATTASLVILSDLILAGLTGLTGLPEHVGRGAGSGLQGGKQRDGGVHDILFGVFHGGGHDAIHFDGLHAEAGKELAHVDGKDYVELLGRIAGEDVGGGRAAEGFDLAVELLVGNGIELQEGILALAKVGAVEFADLGPDFDFGKIEQIGDGHAGLQGIAFADIRHDLAEVEIAGAVLANGNQARDGRERFGVGDALHFTGDVEQALGAVFLEDGELGIGLFLPRLDVGFELPERAFGLFESQQVLLGVDDVEDGILLHVELGVADGVLGFEQLDGVLALGNGGIGLLAFDLLVDLL